MSMDRPQERTAAMKFDNVASDWLALFLAGLGVSLWPHVYLGGMFLALSAAAVARALEPEANRGELWVVLGTAALLAHLVAMVAPAIIEIGQFSVAVQAKMAVVGFLSRSIARMAMRLTGLIEARSDTIADRILDRVLPTKPPGGG
jgi:thiol:disulfide interchange protein